MSHFFFKNPLYLRHGSVDSGQASNSVSASAENLNRCPTGRPAHDAGHAVHSDQFTGAPVPHDSWTTSPFTILALEPLTHSEEIEAALPRKNIYPTTPGTTLISWVLIWPLDDVLHLRVLAWLLDWVLHQLPHQLLHHNLHALRVHSETIISFSIPQWAAVSSTSSQSSFRVPVLKDWIKMSYVRMTSRWRHEEIIVLNLLNAESFGNFNSWLGSTCWTSLNNFWCFTFLCWKWHKYRGSKLC